MKRTLIAAIASFLLVACSARVERFKAEGGTMSEVGNARGLRGDVAVMTRELIGDHKHVEMRAYRIDDAERGITCWFVTEDIGSSLAGGLACLPVPECPAH